MNVQATKRKENSNFVAAVIFSDHRFGLSLLTTPSYTHIPVIYLTLVAHGDACRAASLFIVPINIIVIIWWISNVGCPFYCSTPTICFSTGICRRYVDIVICFVLILLYLIQQGRRIDLVLDQILNTVLWSIGCVKSHFCTCSLMRVIWEDQGSTPGADKLDIGYHPFGVVEMCNK